MNHGKLHSINRSNKLTRLFLTAILVMAGALFGQQLFAQNYTLTINYAGTGSGDVTKDPNQGQYAAGSVVNLTAAADPGSSFENWSGDLSGTNPSTSITMNSDKTVTATFDAIYYSLTITADGSGSVDLSPVGGSYTYNTVVTLTPQPLAGWTFSHWEGDLSGDNDPETITMDGDKSVTAVFTEDSYPLTVLVDGSGSVDLSPVGGSYTYNTVVTLTPVASAGWTFSHWSGGISGSANPGAITMTEEKSVTAHFTQLSYTLTLSTIGNGTATQVPTGPTHLSGTNVNIEATPDAGWEFAEWTGDLESAINPTTVTMDDNKVITANFEQVTYQLTLITDGTPGAAVTPSTPVMVTHGEPYVISASTIPQGYKFKDWTVVGDGVVDIANSTLATTTVTLSTNNVTLQANFELEQYQLTLITDGTPGTAVSPATPVMVTHGQPQVISAVTIPAGYKLKKWTVISGQAAIANDTLATTTATLTNGNTIIQASFELKKYTLTLITDGTPGAAVSPATPVSVTHGAPQIISAVTIPTGFKFKQWVVVSGSVALGNDTLATTTATLTTDNVLLQATFELKKYTLTLVTDGTPGATVLPALPVQVEHGVPQTISANTIPMGYKFKNWTLFSGFANFGNDTMATTTATLTLGNATVQANFQKVIEILNVQIPNVTMKIGDVVTATLSVSNDAGTPYFLVSGTIAGYPLVNLQRLNATTYRATFTVTLGGASYPALADIPVANLVLSDGAIQNIPYNEPIIQNNDALDAKIPVVTAMSVASQFYKVGDIVTLNISADSTHYTAHPLTTINGIPVTAPNVTFVEVGAGNYRLIYTVLEGDTDVPAGMLTAAVTLVKPSGNFNALPYNVIAPNTARIDAHSPVVARMEVSQTEVGPGKAVQLVITADGLGYTGGAGTVINGIPITSDRVSMVEQTGGLYVLNYLVSTGDDNVAAGSLEASVMMTDSAGNNSLAYSIIEANTLEVYTELPTAALAAPPQICQGDPAELTVFLSGRPPWGFDLSDGTAVTSYKFISESPYKIPIALDQTTTFQVDSVWDRNAVVNTGANVEIVVNEKTEVQIMNLVSGYNVEADPFRLIASPSGGIFSGPGVVPATDYFYPSVAGTENSPHMLYYTFVNQHGCTSVDSAQVFVLSAEGDIFIPETSVCNNADMFTVTATNLAGVTGSFKLTNINGYAVTGLSDNGDNSALILPNMLQEGEYIIVYEYFNGVPLFLRDTFSVLGVDVPNILNLNTVYCQSDDPVLLESSVLGAIFAGPGVYGNVSDGFVFYPDSLQPGTYTISCTATSTNECVAVSELQILIRFSAEAGFELSSSCIADAGGFISFENTTDNKLLVENWLWNFDDPGSGSNNTSDQINPTHFYSDPGQRNISLTATTFDGCESSYVMDTLIGNVPVADFTWESNCYGGELGTKFLNKSTSEHANLIGTKWMFYDGNGLHLGDIVSDEYLDSTTYVFGYHGDYAVELLVESALGCTDTARKELSLKETFTPSETGYSEGFNTSQGLWTVQSNGLTASWSWDAPNFDGFTPDPVDKAWFTDLPEGVIGYNEDSWMLSPCFDLSGMEHPLIQMDIMKSFVAGKSGAVLQYMDVVDEGWKTIGAETPGMEWYNAHNIVSEPGGSSTGWGWDLYNPDHDWVTAAHDLDILAGKPFISFRVAFAVEDEAGGLNKRGFAFDNVFLAERSKLAVLEHFTNASDASSKDADDIVDSFGRSNSDEVIDIQYHMEYPGFDPMNANNPGPSSTRSFNYGIPKVPYAILDGGVNEEFRYDFSDLKTTPNIDNMRLLTLQIPAFDVDLEVNWMENILEATTSVTCNVDHYAENIQLYVIVLEASVNAYTGINGDTVFRNVVLDMLPTPAGKLLGDNWSSGSNDTRVNTWVYPTFVEDVEDLAVVAFVQDRNTKQILQAAVEYKTPQVGIGQRPFQMEAIHIYPNPARAIVNVNLGRDSEREGRFELIDMNGRIVLQEYVPSGFQVYQLNVQSLHRGFYLIQWYEEGVLKGRNKLVKVD